MEEDSAGALGGVNEQSLAEWTPKECLLAELERNGGGNDAGECGGQG